MSHPLFHAVGCVLHYRRRLLLLKRSERKSYPGLWGLPGGKVENGETILQAAVRELFEETRILVSGDQIDLFATYLIKNEDMEFHYSVFIYTVDELPSVRTNPHEHTQFLWATTGESLRLQLVPKLKEIVEDVGNAFSLPAQMEMFEEDALGPRLRLDVTSYEAVVARSLISLPIIPPIGPKTVWHVAIGPPGAGKSSTLTRMNELYPNFPLVVDNTIRKTGTRLNVYLKEAFEHGNIARFFHFQMEVLILRWHQTLISPPNALVDESIYSTLAYSRALLRLQWLTKEEYQTFFLHYSRYNSLLAVPRTIFYVRCDPDTLRRRIRKRGRTIEVLYGRPYIETLAESFAEVAAELAKTMNVVSIDTTRMSIDEIASQYAPKA